MQNNILSLMLLASDDKDYTMIIGLGAVVVLFFLVKVYDSMQLVSKMRKRLEASRRDYANRIVAEAEAQAKADTEAMFNAVGKPDTGALDLIVDVLRKSGCEMEELEGDEDSDDRKALHFMYQGESLIVVASNTSTWVRLYDRFWYSVPLDDIDKVAFLRKAINKVNTDYSGVKLLYTFYENKEMYVHTELSFTLLKGMPLTTEYIIGMFRFILGSHGMLDDTMKELREEEKN